MVIIQTLIKPIGHVFASHAINSRKLLYRSYTWLRDGSSYHVTRTARPRVKRSVTSGKAPKFYCFKFKTRLKSIKNPEQVGIL
jgi:hypothetical protein